MTSTKRTIKSLLFAVLLGLPACSPDDPQEPTAIHHGSIGNEPAAGAAGIAAGGNSTSSGSKTGGSSNATGGKTSITVGGSGNTDVGGTTSASGSSSVGGNADVGGSAPVGGASSSIGGASAAGGSTAIGGSSATGGKSSTTGGATGTGGNTGTGGAVTGGASTTGTGGGALTCQPLNNPCWQNIMCCSGVCQNSVCVTPGTGGNTGTGGAATGGASSSIGGASAAGGATATGGSSATGGATVVACTPGLTPTTETAKPFTCTNPGFVRNAAFDAMNVARGNDLKFMEDVWTKDGVKYAVVSNTSSTYAFQSSGANWSLMSDLPSDFGPKLFRDIEGDLCIGGHAPNSLNGQVTARLICKKNGTWSTQPVPFCVTADCSGAGVIDVNVMGISSASQTTVMLATALHEATRNEASQIFIKKQGGSWVRQTLPLTTGLRLHGVWAHSDCDAYAVGQYGNSAIALHYDGSTWSTLTTSNGITAFNSVHGNGSEIYIGGSVLVADNTFRAVTILSSDLVNWQTQEGSVYESAGTALSAVWTPRVGAALLGESHLVQQDDACPWKGGFVTVYSGGVQQIGASILGHAMRVRSLFGDSSGHVIAGADGKDDACNDVAGVYEATCL